MPFTLLRFRCAGGVRGRWPIIPKPNPLVGRSIGYGCGQLFASIEVIAVRLLGQPVADLSILSWSGVIVIALLPFFGSARALFKGRLLCA